MEIADFEVQESGGERSVEAYNGVAHVPNGAEGSHGATLCRGAENPNVSTLIVEWDSLEAHAALTEEPKSKEFGEAIGPCLAGRPRVRHAETVG